MPRISPSKYMVQAGWDDVPHLDAHTKAELLEGTPPYLRAARSKGTPSLGAGAIYPIELDEVLCQPFQIPAYWKRAYALDVGWNRTAALWSAWDPETSVQFLYAEHYMGEELPSIHVQAIQARGAWIPGVIDPASRGRSQKDGDQLFSNYQQLGLHLTPAENGVESGLYTVWQKLATGRLRIFSTLRNLQNEYRLYRRNEKGKVVKEFDHLMDDMRYVTVSGEQVAIAKPVTLRSGSGDMPLDKEVGY